MNETIITAGVGLLSTIIGSTISWFLARRKYNSEVDKTVIDNMESSLDFYQRLSEDNTKRLEDLLNKNRDLEEQVAELRKQILELKVSLGYTPKDKKKSSK